MAMVALLVAVLAIQFRQPRYVPWIYWLVVVFLSVVRGIAEKHLRAQPIAPSSLSKSTEPIAA